MNFSLIYQLMYQSAALIFVFTVHEFVKAYVSHIQGDIVPKNEGRLTLNPVRHFDLLGFLIGLIFGFGWGKPVNTSSMYYENRKKGTILTYSIPMITSMIVGGIFGIICYFMFTTRVYSYNTIFLILFKLFKNITIYSIGNGLFNLLPVSPLDGSVLFPYLLSPEASMKYSGMERGIQMVLLLLLMLGIVSSVIMGVVGLILPDVVFGM